MADCLTILYRGPLASCNYDCAYCPLPKRPEGDDERREDRRALDRFCEWIAAEPGRRLAVFFTPWGEALIHAWYQEAMVRLSRLPHVKRVVSQTNLSCELNWLAKCDVGPLALWCTYHPSQVARDDFLRQCRRLDEAGIRYSVGMVGLRESLAEAEAMRSSLPAHVYLWINALKHVPGYYGEEDLCAWERIDPYFRTSAALHPSFGRLCRTGGNVISVDGDGTVRRCHFIRQPLGNLYDPAFQAPGAMPCADETCECHIGYVHLEELKLEEIFGDGVLKRIPLSFVERGAGTMPARSSPL